MLGYPHLHRKVASEPVIDVIMWEEHSGDARKLVRLLVRHPQNLRGREPGDDGVADRRGEPRCLRRRLNITPVWGRGSLLARLTVTPLHCDAPKRMHYTIGMIVGKTDTPSGQSVSMVGA